MTNDRVKAALAAVVDHIKKMGPVQFRAEIDNRKRGFLAEAFAEIEAFAADYLPVELVVSGALIDAIHWGVTFKQEFNPIDFERWISANDSQYAIAA